MLKMVGFPPNPDDGELWLLPLSSNNTKVQAFQNFRVYTGSGSAVRSTQLDYLTQRYFNLDNNHGFVQKGPIFHGYGTQHLYYHYQFMNPAQLQFQDRS
ncbi:hypothetical protein TB2_028274 [Malus domestica]